MSKSNTDQLEFELTTIVSTHKHFTEHYEKVFSALVNVDASYASDWIYQWVHSTEQGRELLEADTIEHLTKED